MHMGILLIILTIINKCISIQIKYNNENINKVCKYKAINILTCIDTDGLKCIRKNNYLSKYPIFCYNKTIYYIKNSAIYNIYNRSLKLYNIRNSYKLYTNNIMLINYEQNNFNIKYTSGIYITYYYIVPFIEYLLINNTFNNIILKKSIKKNIIYKNGSIILNINKHKMNDKYLLTLLIIFIPLLLFILLIILHIFILIS
ncbi:unknown similar to AMEV159 [Choristoneura rosaceana entomopoxvirus 'L']|uniref:Uncharacterized protein n=1 Tax=Choristoneura rosaceana entomopoxvirus 'L' TaxID=1293539 RepID=A0ABM9QKL0_9POXV|nr:unknown similar to AMEV159 [Choristoneura rosaceana entomopoxvirus 'L']CCU56071.1 unknown similar to AMEV159 [Choristoneura rosaceana entomopoxvirus 'L']